MKPLFLLGRLIFGGFFIYNGIHHFQEHKQLAQYAGAKKVPLPDVAVAVTGAEMILGGASVVLGIKPKLGAALIAGFLAGVSPLIHNFWELEDPGQRMNEMINFSKNLAMLGAALALMSLEEPWPASVPLARSEKQLRTIAA
jgi:putative oxidoreductase